MHDRLLHCRDAQLPTQNSTSRILTTLTATRCTEVERTLARYFVPCPNFAWRAALGMQPMPPVNSGGRYAQKTADIARGMPGASETYSSLGPTEQNRQNFRGHYSDLHDNHYDHITALNASSRQALLHVRRATVLHCIGSSRSKPAGDPDVVSPSTTLL